MRHIPKRYEDAAPTDWNTDHVFRIVMRKYLLEFESLFSQGKAPCFFGVSGEGKTRAACALLNTIPQLTTPPLSVGFYPASETLNRLLDFRDMHMQETYNELWKDLKTTKLIVLDDISTLRDHPRVLEYMWMIIEARYHEMLPTIFTGNFASKDLWGTLSDWFSPAFARRVQENSQGLVALV